MTTQDHVDRLMKVLADCGDAWATAQRWGVELACRLPAGARLLVAGNGGSAAQAQHLSAEFVGRYQADRRPYSALVLHGDASAVTAITNDYGPDELFARQVEAHGQVGDVCLLLSTSGRSRNLLCAAERARLWGLAVWAITGATPNPLAAAADEALVIECANTATVQELHLVALHLICESFDAAMSPSTTGARPLMETLR